MNSSAAAHAAPAAQDRVVRVFIASTFRDMHAERDHLVTVVFPELRERVEQLGLDHRKSTAQDSRIGFDHELPEQDLRHMRRRRRCGYFRHPYPIYSRVGY